MRKKVPESAKKPTKFWPKCAEKVQKKREKTLENFAKKLRKSGEKTRKNIRKILKNWSAGRALKVHSVT